MSDPAVKARCNLFGVLKNIEYLVEKDPECAKLIQGKKVSIGFNVIGGPKGTLFFKNGKAELKPGMKGSKVKLLFTSPTHFNKMVDGKAQPIPYWGFSKIGFLLGPFTKLADKLGFYLKPTDANLKDKNFFKINTEMTLRAAFFSLCEIANYDVKGKENASHLPNGFVQACIKDSVGLYIEVKNHKLIGTAGYHKEPRAVLEFGSIEAANNILNDKMDTFTAIAMGDLEMRGFIPMIEYLNPILSSVGGYLK